jgi:hypothetical protein
MPATVRARRKRRMNPAICRRSRLPPCIKKKEQINGMKNAVCRFIYRESLLLMK